MTSHSVVCNNLLSSVPPQQTAPCFSVEDDLAELAEDEDISDEVKMFLKQFDKQEQVAFSLLLEYYNTRILEYKNTII